MKKRMRKNTQPPILYLCRSTFATSRCRRNGRFLKRGSCTGCPKCQPQKNELTLRLEEDLKKDLKENLKENVKEDPQLLSFNMTGVPVFMTNPNAMLTMSPDIMVTQIFHMPYEPYESFESGEFAAPVYL